MHVVRENVPPRPKGGTPPQEGNFKSPAHKEEKMNNVFRIINTNSSKDFYKKVEKEI